MASEQRTFSSRLLTARLGPLLCVALAGCQALVPDIFEEDDCPFDERPLDSAFASSEGTLRFDAATLILSAAGDQPDCYTGITLRFFDSRPEASCGLWISARPTEGGLGVPWPIDVISFGANEACNSLPSQVRSQYEWDRESLGGTVRVNVSPYTSSQRAAGCLREGLEIQLDARLKFAGGDTNPAMVKEFWLTPESYVLDQPLPVIEAFDCPF